MLRRLAAVLELGPPNSKPGTKRRTKLWSWRSSSVASVPLLPDDVAASVARPSRRARSASASFSSVRPEERGPGDERPEPPLPELMVAAAAAVRAGDASNDDRPLASGEVDCDRLPAPPSEQQGPSNWLAPR